MLLMEMARIDQNDLQWVFQAKKSYLPNDEQ